jgi:long-chain fatty acid transport protein
MTRVRQIGETVLLTLIVASVALAGGFQLNEHGANAMSQGGAFAARASDASAIYFNPAGLGFQTTGSIYLGATGIVPTISFYGPAQDNSNAETKMNSQFFTPINAYITYPVMDRLHVGVGAYNAYGLGTEWPDNWSGKNLITKVDLKTYWFTPTVAYRVSDNLSIGAGVSYVSGTLLLKKAAPFDSRVTLDMTAHGWGFDAGIDYKATPELTVGLTYRSKVKVDASGSAGFVPDIPVLPGGGVTSSITLPPTGYAAVAYKFCDALSLEADYQYIGWSSYDNLTFTFTKDGSSTSAPKNYSDTYILRVGGEYLLGSLKLRGGFYYDHTPVSDPYVDPLLPDANRYGLSAGIGLNLTDHLKVDVGYLFIKFLDRSVTNTIPATSFDGTYKSFANLFSLDLGYSL